MLNFPRPRLYYFCVFLGLLFSGCAYKVAITYLKPRQPTLQQAAIANVYMIVQRPDVSGSATVSKFGLQKEADFPIELDIDRFAARMAVFLRDRGGRLSAYRVQGTSADRFADALGPSSILYVNFNNPSVTESEGTEESTEKVDGEIVKKEVHYWTSKASLQVSARLVNYADHSDLGHAEKNFEQSERFTSPGEGALRSRYIDLVTPLIDQAADWTVKAVIPIDIVTRKRVLYAVSNDKESDAAAQAGERQHWAEAVPIWKNRLEANPSDWRNAWNLGVWAERQRDFSAARSYYQKAKEASINDKKAPKGEDWDQIAQDLDQPLGMSVTEPDHAQSWFSQRIAVLPFSDVSTSIDGPVNVRHLAREALAKNGYNALALEDVDTLLHENGFSQGGQLGATTPEQLAKWLNVDLLLFGNLDKFDEFTMGLFGWKRINGTFKIWSAAKKDYLWISEKSVSRVATSTAKSGKDLAWSFLQQLAESWIDKASHKPMSEECAYFVNEQLVEFPRRPFK